MSFRGMLNQHCDLRLTHAEPDGMGGQLVRDEIAIANVRCSINPISSREAEYYQRLGQQVTHVMWLEPRDADLGIDARWRVVLEDGVTYGIVDGPLDIGGRHRIWQFILQRTT